MTADAWDGYDGRWHAPDRFSPHPVPVRTLKGVQHHYGSHATVQRWNGSEIEYRRCGCIHKRRDTTHQCAIQLARKLNEEAGR